MKLLKRFGKSFLPIIYAGMLLALVFYVLFYTDITDVFRGYPNEHYQSFTSGWKSQDGSEASLKKLPSSDADGRILLSNILPDVIPYGESLNLISHNIRFSLYLDDVKVYDYYPEKNLTGSGTGDVYHNISLTASDAGKTVTIEVLLPYVGESGGRFSDAVISNNRTFYYLIFRQNGMAFYLSSLIIFFGIAVVIIHFGMYRENKYGYNLLALALASTLIGAWTLIETNVPQILLGSINALRVLDYTLLPLMLYPMIVFINSITKRPSKVYPLIAFATTTLSLGSVFAIHFIFGTDMHNLMPIFFSAYIITIILVFVILINNYRYCKEREIPADLTYFAFGATFFTGGGLIDLIRYQMSGHSKNSNGSFLRFGLFIFIATMFLQIIRWLTQERRTNRRDSFVNSLMHYSMTGESPEDTIKQMLEYLGKELLADRTYIFEDAGDGTYKNTYAWSVKKASARPAIETVPYDGFVDIFYEEYERSNIVMIQDISDRKETNPIIYNICEPRGIKSLVTAPLRIDGKYAGFFGVDNPPSSNIEEISGIMQLLEYFLSEIMLQRDNQEKLIQYSYYDQMTGTKNRRALHEFEISELNTKKPYGYVMFDINGLKKMNDTEGHEAGDMMIKDVADALISVFSKEKVFRMGGDEFAAYSMLETEDKFLEAIERVKRLITEKGRSSSIGYIYRSAGDSDYEAVKKEADAMMYADKERYYAGRNDRRSR